MDARWLPHWSLQDSLEVVLALLPRDYSSRIAGRLEFTRSYSAMLHSYDDSMLNLLPPML